MNEDFNYIDFNFAIRNDKNFKELVLSLITSLKERNIITWIDLNDIWMKHQNGMENNGMVLVLLAALEINLQNNIF